MTKYLFIYIFIYLNIYLFYQNKMIQYKNLNVNFLYFIIQQIKIKNKKRS